MPVLRRTWPGRLTRSEDSMRPLLRRTAVIWKTGTKPRWEENHTLMMFISSHIGVGSSPNFLSFSLTKSASRWRAAQRSSRHPELKSTSSREPFSPCRLSYNPSLAWWGQPPFVVLDTPGHCLERRRGRKPNVKHLLLCLRRNPPWRASCSRQSPATACSWASSRAWSTPWRTSSARWGQTLRGSLQNTRCCWTSRPDWSWRSLSIGDCWTEKVKSKNFQRSCLVLLVFALFPRQKWCLCLF